jgi:hypothetical protein
MRSWPFSGGPWGRCGPYFGPSRRWRPLPVICAICSSRPACYYGPCIAVTLNDKLDYFGSTVNIASRLEHLSEGGDIVISAAVHDDPEVLELLGEEEPRFSVERVEATLKGFEEERFELRRLKIVQ